MERNQGDKTQNTRNRAISASNSLGWRVSDKRSAAVQSEPVEPAEIAVDHQSGSEFSSRTNDVQWKTFVDFDQSIQKTDVEVLPADDITEEENEIAASNHEENVYSKVTDYEENQDQVFDEYDDDTENQYYYEEERSLYEILRSMRAQADPVRESLINQTPEMLSDQDETVEASAVRSETEIIQPDIDLRNDQAPDASEMTVQEALKAVFADHTSPENVSAILKNEGISEQAEEIIVNNNADNTDEAAVQLSEKEKPINSFLTDFDQETENVQQLKSENNQKDGVNSETEKAIGQPDDDVTHRVDLSDDVSLPKGIKKKPKRKMWLIPLILILFLGIVYFAGMFFYRNHFLPNTVINGISFTNAGLDEAKVILQSFEQDYRLNIIASDQSEETITGVEVDFKVADDIRIKQVFDAQSVWSWPIAFLRSPQQIALELFTYNADMLEQRKSSLYAVQSSGTVMPQSARPIIVNGMVVIQDEIQGNILDYDAFSTVLHQALSTGITQVKLSDYGCYVKPTFSQGSPEVKRAKTLMENALRCSLTYVFGTASETVDRDRIISWLTVDELMNIQLDHDLVSAYLTDLSKRYPMRDPNNSELEIDLDKEIQVITPMIQTGGEIVRAPIYKNRFTMTSPATQTQ